MSIDFGGFTYPHHRRRRRSRCNSTPGENAPPIFTDQLLKTMTFTFHPPEDDSKESDDSTRLCDVIKSAPFGSMKLQFPQTDVSTGTSGVAPLAGKVHKSTQVVCERRLATILENDPRNSDNELMKSHVFLRDHGVQTSKRQFNRGRCYSAADADDVDDDGVEVSALTDDIESSPVSRSFNEGPNSSGCRKQRVNSNAIQRKLATVIQPDHQLLDINKSWDAIEKTWDTRLVGADPFDSPPARASSTHHHNGIGDRHELIPPSFSKGYISPNWSPILARKKIAVTPTSPARDGSAGSSSSQTSDRGSADRSESPVSESSEDEVTVIEVMPPSGGDTEDMDKLKELTNRLNLVTRRPSYVQWKQQYIDTPWASHWRSSADMETQKRSRKSLDEGRLRKLDENIDMLKQELSGMREQDRAMAKQLIEIRRRIYQFKLERSCDEHQEMLDDVQDELEELVETDKISDLVEIPIDRVMAMPLRQHGITRMHISRRRFSVF
ncbi:uncharacterized protein LOC141910399 [Tubulanus polymorphus]|uniref:uncharacterized protein LOC141910399 n=1 Tax=Tubulanus polymorphus TaxID=672921 RepID=UPI003DA21B8C